MTTRLRNSTKQQTEYPEVRSRSRNRQFRLTTSPEGLSTGDDASPSTPTAINIVVPSQINSELSPISSGTNVASLNVVSKSLLPSQLLNTHKFDNNPKLPERDSWMEQSHSTSLKKYRSSCDEMEKCTTKECATQSPSRKSWPPCTPPQHDLKVLKQRLIKYRAETENFGDAAALNAQLNEIFVRRLVDIENVAKDDSDVKLITYQEWVDMLMEINVVIIGNMADLESEVAERLECMKRRIKSTCSQTSTIEQKYRQDICSLVQLLKNAYHHNNWDTQGFEFQTINLAEILGAKNTSCSNPEFKNITENTSNIWECVRESTICNMPPINFEQQSSRSASTQVSAGLESCNELQYFAEECSYDSLSTAGKLEHQKLKSLDVELNELFEITKEFKHRSLEYHRKRLSDIFQRMESEKSDAYRKLDFIRKQLVNLEISSGEFSQQCINDSDSGFSSKCDNGQDAKILNALRNRLCRHSENNFQLKKCVQLLEVENNELSTSLKSEKNFAKLNSNTLKDLADLLSEMSGKQFDYENIYNESSKTNPFCQAIVQMKCDFEEREGTLRNSLQKQCEQNENLHCQVRQLQYTVLEKEQCLEELNKMLDQLRCEQQQKQQQRNHECCLQAKDNDFREMCRKLEQANKKVDSLIVQLQQSQRQERFLLSETRKLNEELNENKRKYSNISIQMHRLNALLKAQETCRTNICKKYDELERNYEDQAKQLRAACAQMNCLQERLAVMDKRQEEHNMERNLLREEVLALKEKEADLLKKQRCFSEKIMKTEKELYTAHNVMKEQQHIMQRNESTQKDCMKRLQDANSELKNQFNDLCNDYKRLEDEYRKQYDLLKQNEKVIESFRKWKEAQLKADDATRASFNQYDEHIKLLLEEKQKFINQYRTLIGDYRVLQREFEGIRLNTLSFNTSVPTSNVSENSIPHRMELIRSTSLRVSQASSSVKCDVTSHNTVGSTPP